MEPAGTAGSKIFPFALTQLDGYAGNWHVGATPPRSEMKIQFGQNYIVSWLDLDDRSNHCLAGYSIFGTTASQFPGKSPKLSKLNEVLVLPILPMILCKYFCQFPG